MIPVYRDGDAILVFREQRYDFDHYVGQEVALHTHDGRRFVKELQHGNRRGIYNLYSYNARLIESVGLVWVGQIYLIVKAHTIRKITANQQAATSRRAKNREKMTDGMDELPLDKQG